MNMMKNISLLSVVALSLLTTGCNQVRVDRWSDLERPCQPHGFFVAPAGETLASVAQTCKAPESVLRKYNGWLITRQPFAEPTVIWLKQNPNVVAGDEDLLVQDMDVTQHRKMATESLAPIALPPRTK